MVHQGNRRCPLADIDAQFPVQDYLFTWNKYYWAANVLLAEVTDGGTFHQQAQNFLAQWVCGFNQLISYTGKGRAWNTNDGTLASTQNAVFLAARYAKYALPSDKKRSIKYLCWARAQVASWHSMAVSHMSVVSHVTPCPWPALQHAPLPRMHRAIAEAGGSNSTDT